VVVEQKSPAQHALVVWVQNEPARHCLALSAIASVGDVCATLMKLEASAKPKNCPKSTIVRASYVEPFDCLKLAGFSRNFRCGADGHDENTKIRPLIAMLKSSVGKILRQLAEFYSIEMNYLFLPEGNGVEWSHVGEKLASSRA
jgi:hypothetical protein